MITDSNTLVVLHATTLIIFSVALFVITEILLRKLRDIITYTETSHNEMMSLYENLSKKSDELDEKTRENLRLINELDRRVLNLERKILDLMHHKTKTPHKEKVKLPKPIAKEESKEIKRRAPILTPTQRIIIEKLKEGPKTYKEIKNETKLSREHIARELKKLYEMGLLDRDESSKPYVYTLKEEVLREREIT